MTNLKHITEYAGNLKGTAMYAMESWRWNRGQVATARDDAERMIYEGRCQAYASIVKLITGRNPEDPIAQDVIDYMGSN